MVNIKKRGYPIQSIFSKFICLRDPPNFKSAIDSDTRIKMRLVKSMSVRDLLNIVAVGPVAGAQGASSVKKE